MHAAPTDSFTDTDPRTDGPCNPYGDCHPCANNRDTYTYRLPRPKACSYANVSTDSNGDTSANANVHTFFHSADHCTGHEV